MIKVKHFLIGTIVSSSVFAGTMGEAVAPVVDTHPWSVIGSIGYSYYSNAAAGAGTPIGRLAIGKNLYNSETSEFRLEDLSLPALNLGLEFGVQNGNRMSLAVQQSTLNAMGGLPIWTTVKPMLDLLGTLQVKPMQDVPAFLIVKGGVIWREWMLERDTINNKSQAGGEIQAGIGTAISEKATLSVLYQGIFGSNANFVFNSATGTGTVSNIPTQNGVLLSLSMAF